MKNLHLTIYSCAHASVGPSPLPVTSCPADPPVLDGLRPQQVGGCRHHVGHVSRLPFVVLLRFEGQGVPLDLRSMYGSFQIYYTWLLPKKNASFWVGVGCGQIVHCAVL